MGHNLWHAITNTKVITRRHTMPGAITDHVWRVVLSRYLCTVEDNLRPIKSLNFSKKIQEIILFSYIFHQIDNETITQFNN